MKGIKTTMDFGFVNGKLTVSRVIQISCRNKNKEMGKRTRLLGLRKIF